MINKTKLDNMSKTYTVNDIIQAGCMLEPIECIHCHNVGDVVYHQYIGNGDCGICGKWQLSEDEESNK